MRGWKVSRATEFVCVNVVGRDGAVRTIRRLIKAKRRCVFRRQFLCIVCVCGLGLLSEAAATYAGETSLRFGRVELLRDSWGVPHVFARSDAAAFYGLGYAAAEDRGFQMYYFLRIMQGRMSEVFGVIDKKKVGGVGPHNTLEHDQLMRAFGFVPAAERVVENLKPDVLLLLEAYCAGVNDYFKNHAAQEHYLFRKTGLRREPWTPADCILSWWHFAQFFSKNGLRDYPGLSMPDLPPGRRGRRVIDDDAAVVRREDVSEEWIKQVDKWIDKMGLAPTTPDGPQNPDPKFSHAWVVGGRHTTTKASVLVSDPQTPVWNPNMLYEFHAQGKSFNARGIGVAGSPIILIGFNQHVAWGLTALGADQADLFILKTDAAHPDQYQVDDRWLDMTVRDEVIRIKDGEPVTMKVRETIFGPIVSEFVWRNPKGQEVALCRVPLIEPDRTTLDGALGMMRSKSCEEFAAGLPGWRFPTANCIFGDRQGNIGYWSLGALPVRSMLTQANGSHAQDGSTRKGMWRGMVPYDILPHCMNPKRGYIVSANHRTIQSFYHVPFGNMTGSAGDTDRGLRVKERILEQLGKGLFTPDAVLQIHFDSVNVWKREIVRLGLKVLKDDPDKLSPNTRRALEYLRNWFNQGARSDLSIRGTEFANNMAVLFRGTTGVVNTYGGGVSGLAGFAKSVRARHSADPNCTITEDELVFVDQTLDQTWRSMQAQYGSDVRRWNALAKAMVCRQTIGYLESLDGFPSLDSQYDVHVPALATIDGSTVLSQRAQSYTQFVPLNDTDKAQTLLPMGNSDNPASPYRFSTYGDWPGKRLHPAPLSHDAVEAIAVSRKTLGDTPPSRATNSRPTRSRSRTSQPSGRGSR